MSAPAITVRLVLVSVVLPALFVASDQAALRYAGKHGWSPISGVVVCTWFTLQTAVLSHLAGGKLPNWGWRLLLLGWSLVLVNFLLATGAMDDWSDQRLLALAFLSAECGVLGVWLILGTGWLPLRLAFVGLAFLPVKYLADVLHFDLSAIRWWDVWPLILAVQIAATCGLAALLKIVGYSIEQESGEIKEGIGGPVQFSIRHMLIATTVVAVLVPIVQALLRSSLRWMDRAQWLHASADGLVLALISLAAIWATLGSGRWPLKALVFALLALLAGGGLYWLESASLYSVKPYSSGEPLTHAGWRWFAWTLLTGSFLAGMLLVLRATGYRLVRRRRLPA